MAVTSTSAFSRSVVSTPSLSEGLPKVRYWGTSRFGHLCSQCSSVCGSSLHSGHAGSAAGSSKWTYALRIGVCPHRRRARRTASARLEAAMKPAFQEKCSYTMAVLRLLDGGSVMVRRMRAFTVASRRGRDGCRWRWHLLSPIRQRPRCLLCPYNQEPR